MVTKQKQTVQERIALVTKDQTVRENQKINKTTEIVKVDKRKFNKGIVGKAGRPPSEAKLAARGIRELIDNHVNEVLTLNVIENGVKKEVQRTRLMAALEKLYNLGTAGKGDADAISKWLDRALGKPAQPIVGDDEAAPIRIEVGPMLNKIYDI